MQNIRDPKLTVLLFNEMINNRDIDGLSQLMHPDHVFIDSTGHRLEGKQKMVEGWLRFFELYPDYVNHFEIIRSSGNQVAVLGQSSCSFQVLDGPAIWKATVEMDLLKVWQIFDDTEEKRKQFDLEGFT